MKKHPENSAVAQCSECGAGVCKDCASITNEVREYFGTLCLDCYEEHVRTALVNTREELRRITRRIKGKKFFCMLGLICFALAGLTFIIPLPESLIENIPYGVGPYLPFLGIGWFFCGIYSAISGWKVGAEAHAETEERFGVTYNVYDDGTVSRDQGWGIKIFGFVLGLVFGVVATPLSLLTDSNKKREAQEKVTMFEEELEKLSTL